MTEAMTHFCTCFTTQGNYHITVVFVAQATGAICHKYFFVYVTDCEKK
jgi:hypothetical protein